MWLFRNKLFLAAICIFIALFFTFVVTPQYQNYINKTVEVVQLTKNITANTLITENLLIKKHIRFSEVPKNAITSKQEVIGKYASVPIFTGDYLTPIKIVDEKPDKGYLSNLNNKLTAVAINMPSLSASLAGQIKPGDVVSVVAYDKRQAVIVTPKELEFVTVIDVINNDGVSVFQNNSKGLNIVTSAISSEDIIPSSVVFMCTIDQSLKLVELENMGKVHLIYRKQSTSFTLGGY